MERMHHRPASVVAFFAAFIGMSSSVLAASAPNLALWDTGSPLTGAPDSIQIQWRPVPAETLDLEKDPLKAASDPGYYGREYVFAGDAVVANSKVAMVFQSQLGRMTLFAKDLLASGADAKPGNLGRKIAELIPIATGVPVPSITGISVIRNFADEVALEVSFAAKQGADANAVFLFDRTGIVEVRPRGDAQKFSVHGVFEHAVVPSFVGDDLIYSANSNSESVALPAENALVALVSGEAAELVMTWPSGDQQVDLRSGAGADANSHFGTIDFNSAGRSFYLTPLVAQGIWHNEKLGVAYLEKDVRSDWKRPFPAKWQTQLLESKVRTTYAFRAVKGEIWRGVPGSYIYPVWFDGDTANFHLSKKIPPKGNALIYYLEGENTPTEILTPADLIKATLGRSAAEEILDVEGRKLRTHHRRTSDALTHRACTCGYTEAIQALFEKKTEVTQKDDVAASLDDMVYFVKSHVARINEYRKFADEMSTFFKEQSATHPALKSYFENLDQIVAQIPEEYNVQKENMKSLDYASQLVKQTMALTDKDTPGSLDAYMELLKAWRGMGGAQDYVVARCHMISRQLAQAAGYGCGDSPDAAAQGREIRARCKKILRDADGYEIWANY